MKKINIYFLILAIIHFCLVTYYNQSYHWEILDTAGKITYYICVKLLAFILTAGFYQLISTIIKGFKEHNNEIISETKHTLIYFVLNIIVLIGTYPLISANISSINAYYSSIYFNVQFFPNWIQSLYCAVFYNIIPTIMGLSICLIFLYSLIFSYVINRMKKIAPHFWGLLYIPFCFPCILILNASLDRSYTGSWLIIYITLFAFLNINKKISNSKIAIFYGIITAVGAEIRSEHIILIALIPIMVFLYKVFTRKNCLIYTITLLAFFVMFSGIANSNKNYNFGYELHNLSFIYDAYRENNFKNSDIEKNIGILNKIYYKPLMMGNKASYPEYIDLSNKKDCLTGIYILMKFALNNSIYFIKNNIKVLSIKEIAFIYAEDVSGIDENNPEINKIIPYIQNTNLIQHKITRLLLNFQNTNKINIILKKIYSPYLCFILVLILIPMFVYLKKTYIIPFCIIWGFILYITLIFGYYCLYIYYFPFVQNTWVVFFTTIILVSEKIKTDKFNNIAYKKET